MRFSWLAIRILILTVTFIQVPAYSQLELVPQPYVSYGWDNSDVDFPETDLGFFMGSKWYSPSSGGILGIYRTNDRGGEWEEIWHTYVEYHGEVLFVKALDSLRCYISFYTDFFANLIFTSDGGKGWTDCQLGGSIPHEGPVPRELFMINDTTGFFTAMETVDSIGIMSKLYRLDVTTPTEINSVIEDSITWFQPFFTSEDSGYIRARFASDGSSGIIKTVDGGMTMLPCLVSDSLTFNGMDFFDPFTGIVICSNGFIMRTENAGDTWELSVIAPGHNLMAVDLVDERTGFIGGEDGNLFITLDKGNTWTQIPLTFQYDWEDIDKLKFFSEFSGFIRTQTNLYYYHSSSGYYEIDKYSYELKISPNPAFTQITVEWLLSIRDQASEIILDIMDIRGRTIISKNTPVEGPSMALDISMLPEGCYFLILRTGDAVRAASKIIKLD